MNYMVSDEDYIKAILKFAPLEVAQVTRLFCKTAQFQKGMPNYG